MRANRESAAYNLQTPGAALHRERLIAALASVMQVSGFSAGNRVSASTETHTSIARSAIWKHASGRTGLT